MEPGPKGQGPPRPPVKARGRVQTGALRPEGASSGLYHPESRSDPRGLGTQWSRSLRPRS